MMFDEVSAWWPSKDMIQPDTKQLETSVRDATQEDLEATSEEKKSPTTFKTKKIGF
jgi:hypothetical protein